MDGAQITAILGGVVVIFGSIGGGISFVWGKIEKRFAGIEADLKQARRDLDACKERDGNHKARMAELLTLFRMLIDDMHQNDPANPLLRVARATLARWLPEPTPPEIVDLLNKIPSVP